jgi:TM2 domain-containing membrane protein YozV
VAVAAGVGAKSSGVAALLSFLFVGAGQIYVGDDMGRAVGLLVGGFVLFVIGWVTLILLIPALGLWIWNIFDAHNRAKAWNVQHGFPAG